MVFREQVTGAVRRSSAPVQWMCPEDLEKEIALAFQSDAILDEKRQ